MRLFKPPNIKILVISLTILAFVCGNVFKFPIPKLVAALIPAISVMVIWLVSRPNDLSKKIGESGVKTVKAVCAVLSFFCLGFLMPGLTKTVALAMSLISTGLLVYAYIQPDLVDRNVK